MRKLIGWKHHLENTTFPGAFAFNPELSFVQRHNLLGNSQADPDSQGRRRFLEECLKNPLNILGLDPDPGIRYFRENIVPPGNI